MKNYHDDLSSFSFEAFDKTQDKAKENKDKGMRLQIYLECFPMLGLHGQTAYHHRLFGI